MSPHALQPRTHHARCLCMPRTGYPALACRAEPTGQLQLCAGVQAGACLNYGLFTSALAVNLLDRFMATQRATVSLLPSVSGGLQNDPPQVLHEWST